MKKTFTLFLLSCIGLSLSAATVSKQQAQRQAARFLSQKHHASVQVQSVEMQVSDCNRASARPGDEALTEYNSFYAFNATNGQGYVLMSADDRMPAILGYSLSGQWPQSTDELPPALQDVLYNYQRLTDDVRSGRRVMPELQSAGDDAHQIVVEPLLTTTWAQGYPYNMYTPEVTGEYSLESSLGRHFAIGCGAVALGQIINYHKGPLHPRDYATHYTYQTNEEKDSTITQQRVEVTLQSSTTYDFANIPDSIKKTPEASNLSNEQWQTQAEAVATLLRDVAYSLEMSWTCKGGGTAINVLMEQGAVAGMGMSSDCRTLHSGFLKQGLDNPLWWESIQSSLDARRPVLAGGSDKNGKGGHAFVYDGYDSSHFVHVNWGWGGKSNNWFDIHFLKTDMYDANEDGSSDYASNNIIVCNLHPCEETEELQPSLYKHILFNPYATFDDIDHLPFKRARRHTDVLQAKSEIIMLLRPMGYEADLCCNLTDESEQTIRTYDAHATEDFVELNSLTGSVRDTIDTQSLPNGTYSFTLTCRSRVNGMAGEWANFNDLMAKNYFRLDDQHIIINPGTYDLQYHDPNCLHIYEPSDKEGYATDIAVHIDYSGNPEAIEPGDSTFTIFASSQITKGLLWEVPNPEAEPSVTITFYDAEGQLIGGPIHDQDFEEQLEDFEFGNVRTSTFRSLKPVLAEGRYTMVYSIPMFDYTVERELIVGNPQPVGVEQIAAPQGTTRMHYDLMGRPIKGQPKAGVLCFGMK